MAVGSRKPVRWHQTVSYMVAWLISTGLLAIDLFLVRGVVNDVLTSIAVRRSTTEPDQWRAVRLTYGWTAETIDWTILLIIACVGIALVIFIETYYRRGLPEGLLRHRVMRVVGLELAVGIVAWLISALLTWFTIQVAT